MKVMLIGALWGAFSLLLYTNAAAIDMLHTNAAVIDIPDVATEEYCATCIQLDPICYNHSYLFELNVTHDQDIIVKKMGILQTNNVLYFSFEPNFDDPEFSHVAYASMDSPNLSSILYRFNGEEIMNFTTFDINQVDERIYLGGNDGIWIVMDNNVSQYPTQNISYLNSKKQTITNIIGSMCSLYFTKENVPGIVKNKDCAFEVLLKEVTVKVFVLDNTGDTVVYLDNIGLLYAYRKQSGDHVRYNAFFSGLTIDLNGVAYAWDEYGIYKVTLSDNLLHSKLVKVSNVQVDAMTFDGSNNIIYSKGRYLFEMTRTNIPDCINI